MRLDFIISSITAGGAERVLILLANHLAENGHQVSVVSLNKGEAYPISKKINRVRLHHGKIKIHRIRGLANLIKYYQIKEKRPDVIISFITLLNLITIIVSKVYKIPIIVSEHNSYLRFQKPKWLCDFTRTFLYPKVNFVTVLTSFDLPYYNKKGCKTVVMPNPVTFSPIAKIPRSRKKQILAVGNLDRYHHKGFDNLIAFIAPILQKHQDWNLKIIGGGEKGMKFLKELAVEKNVAHKIYFTGQVNNVRDLMYESEIFVLPSRFEGLPMVLLEAMSQGIACIAYDCITGPSEMIENNLNGLLINDQQEKLMQKGLLSLIESPSLRTRLGENAIKSLDSYSMENVSSQWEKLFLKIKNN